MKKSLDEKDLQLLSTFIASHMGLNFTPDKWLKLEESFFSAAVDLGFSDVSECVQWFITSTPSRDSIEKIACYLTIGETYFLRESRCFSVLEQLIIPELHKKRHGDERRLRIWSAGCASGEEAYSIAITLKKMSSYLRGWEIHILGTDINPNALKKAEEGVYSNWSFRNVPADFKQRYFRKKGDGKLEILPEIRDMVVFSSLNLVEDKFPSIINGTNAMDVIFCRNVLMYFTPELAGHVVSGFQQSLLNDGWLFVSPSEAGHPLFKGFAPVNFPDATLYRKDSNGNGSIANQPLPSLRSTVVQSEPQKPPVLQPHPPKVKIPVYTANKTVVPENQDHYREGLLFYQSGAYRQAAEKVIQHLSEKKDDTSAMALLSRIYANQGRLEEALKLSDQALSIDRLSGSLHYLRAVILHELGGYEDAVSSLKKAIYIDNAQPLAHYTLANLELKRGRKKESRRHFEHALILLEKFTPDEIIPDSDGMVAGRLREVIRSTTVRIQEES